GDLYKNQIMQLSQAMGVPEIIINKAPSADLWVGQTDEDELGFTYAEADQLLYLMVDQRYSAQDCIERGFSADFVDNILDRVRRSHFKRIMPPIAKLTNRTIGYDFLYLRDWGT
ncbi:MAG: NAD(+) synthase, partial [Anaerolineae bacterium]|nr:NAD(+) synthase [Anaerolineae bacterium]